MLGKALREKTNARIMARHAPKESRGDATNVADLRKHLKCVDRVINCIGLSPMKPYTEEQYRHAHVDVAKALSKVLTKKHTLIQISALGEGNTAYLRTKNEAENVLNKCAANVIIIRPSIILSEESEMYEMALKFPFFPKIPAQVQPITLEEAVDFILKKRKPGTYSLAGKETMTMYALVRKIREAHGKRTIPLPGWLPQLAWPFTIFPFLTGDMLRATKIHSAKP